MTQDRDIQNVLKSLNKKPSELDKRLAYLEKAEYSRLNYYASISLVSASWVDASAGFVSIPGMAEKFLKGFTLTGSDLTCVQPGLYHATYNITVHCSVALTARSVITVDGVDEIGSEAYSQGGALSYLSLSGTTILTAAVGDVIRLTVYAVPGISLIAAASFDLTRVDDN